MKNYLAFFFFISAFVTVGAQALYEKFESGKLEGFRHLKIQLPRNYDPEDKKEYPLVLVMDGDYLFEPVAGNVDYQSYWEDIPECIVVGIEQAQVRSKDFYYDNETFFPAHDGANFFEFVTMELLPYLEGKYNISDFKIIMGHDLSANFINYYMFKIPPIFRAVVAMSPDLAPEMSERIAKRMATLDIETFYYMSTADGDLSRLKNLQSKTWIRHWIRFRVKISFTSLITLKMPIIILWWEEVFQKR